MVYRLPNYENAVIPNDKIVGYCLNLNHERGRHKARVFKQVFGITANDGEILKNTILNERWIQVINATLSKLFSLLAKTSLGVLYPNLFLGLLFKIFVTC